MKIALVSDAIYPYNKGGKEKRLHEISTRLVEKGHEVHIYCMKWWKEPTNYRIENKRHLHAITPYYPLYSGERRSIKQGILFSIACLKLLKEDFDVIDVDHMPYFPLFFVKIVCVLRQKKMIATWHEVWGKSYWITYMGWLGIIAAGIERLSVLLPDYIVSVSSATTEKLKRDLNYKGQITTAANGVDTEYIHTIKPSEIHSDIIFAGRLLKHKNIDLLLKAVIQLKKTYPNIIAVLIGDGPEKANLITLTQKENLQNNVRFYSFFDSTSELYALMKSSKVFVLPSTREGFGLVVLEANACGIPVVTVKHSENHATKLIQDTNGLLCDSSVSGLEKAINAILTKNVTWQKEKARIISSVDIYSWSTTVTEVINVYTLCKN